MKETRQHPPKTSNARPVSLFRELARAVGDAIVQPMPPELEKLDLELRKTEKRVSAGGILSLLLAGGIICWILLFKLIWTLF
jgi:hypothetical protein